MQSEKAGDQENVINRQVAEKIYLACWDDAVRVAQIILNDHSAAEDCAQTAMIKLFEHIDKVDTYPSPRTKGYLIVITRNLAYREYNLQKRILNYTEEAERQLNDSTDGRATEDIALDNWTSEVIADALARLPDRDSDILVLTYGFDHSTAECADLMGMSVEAARKALQRARQKLRKELDKIGYR